MRRILVLIAGALVLMMLAACGGNKVDDGTAEKYSAQAEEIILLLNEGEYEAVFEQLNDDMKAGLPVSEMEELTPIIEESGDFETIDKASVEEQDGMYVTVSRAKYTEKNRVYTITFNSDDEIAGLFIK